MCRVLELSPSGYYAWCKRAVSARALSDAALLCRIERIHRESGATYGVPRVHAQLVREDIRVGRNHVARLMKRAGLKGVTRRKWVRTTRRDAERQGAADLVECNFVAAAPNQLWVADITYIPTWAGFLYLAIVVDVFSRRIVGWSMAVHLRSELVLEALEMAFEQRSPNQVVHHSDHGTQYTSVEFGKRCTEMGVRPSMGSVGDTYDNAMAESFFATLECELLDRCRFKTIAEAEAALFSFIEGWYNPRRLHSSLGYVPPIEFEQRYHDRAKTPRRPAAQSSNRASVRTQKRSGSVGGL
jgi:putative transposase